MKPKSNKREIHKVLNRIVDKVLSFKPKPETKKAKEIKDEKPKRD